MRTPIDPNDKLTPSAAEKVIDSLQRENARLREEKRIAVEALESVRRELEDAQWGAHDGFCFVCTAAKSQGHFSGCQIGKALSLLSPNPPISHD